MQHQTLKECSSKVAATACKQQVYPIFKKAKNAKHPLPKTYAAALETLQQRIPCRYTSSQEVDPSTLFSNSRTLHKSTKTSTKHIASCYLATSPLCKALTTQVRMCFRLRCESRAEAGDKSIRETYLPKRAIVAVSITLQ